MKLQTILFLLLSLPLSNLYAESALVGIRCDDDAMGAKVYLNGVYKGECPVNYSAKEGKLSIRVVKSVDDEHEQVFTKELEIIGGVVERVIVELSAPQLTACLSASFGPSSS